MEIQGKLIAVLDEVSGESSNGTWRKKEYVIETAGQYPKKVAFAVWGDKINAMTAKIGDTITAHIEIESREYKGRWYTEVKAWKFELGTTTAATTAPIPSEKQGGEEEESDLPF